MESNESNGSFFTHLIKRICSRSFRIIVNCLLTTRNNKRHDSLVAREKSKEF